MRFVTRTLGSICDEVGGTIRTGPFGSQLHESDYRESGTPVVMPKNIIDGRISEDDIARIGSEDESRLYSHKLQVGDIVYGRRGDIGRRALVAGREADWICGTGCLRISLGDSVLNPVFLYYYLGQPEVTAWIYNQSVGATLPNLNTDILRSVSIKFPELKIQRRIASILSTYDDLIENNSRRIEILEEMARSLYREWFVNFRFQGHRKTSDNLPSGWAVKKLGDLVDDRRTTVLPSDIPSHTPYVGLEHIPRRSFALKEWGNACDVQSTKLSFRKGDILFGKIRPYFHKVVAAPIEGVCSTDTIVIFARSTEWFPIALMTIFSDEFVNHATQTSNGTKMPRANWDVLLRYSVTVPPIDILNRFNEVVNGAVNQITNLLFRNRVLREMRDLLLPKLISGEIDVSQFPSQEAEVTA